MKLLIPGKALRFAESGEEMGARQRLLLPGFGS